METQTGRVKSNNRPVCGPLDYRCYGVALKFPHKQVAVAYDVTMLRLSADKQPEYSFTLYRDKVFVNEYEPQLYIEELAAEVAACLYPLDLNINTQTGARFVLNADVVSERWKNKKKQLKLSHEGPWVEQYFAQMDNVTEAPESLEEALFHNDIMVALLTHPVHINYGVEHKTEQTILMPLGNYNKPVLFKGEQWIDTDENDYGGIFVCFAGIARTYVVQDGQNIAEDLELKVEYNLDADDFTIRDIVATVRSPAAAGEDRVLVDMTAYCRQEKEQEYREQRAAFHVDIGRAEPAARKGFFGNWFRSKK